MKLKSRPGDFRVRELLIDGYLRSRGEHRVYKVVKRKLTSEEAASVLAREADVRAREVSMAGLKDRQGETLQFMSLHGGPPVRYQDPNLSIESVGGADEAYSSQHSRGNGFEIIVRDLLQPDLELLEHNLAAVREHGLPNYFDDQRFGNLRHGQGWIAKEVMQGRLERALQQLLIAPSDHDDAHAARYKAALRNAWGQWADCLKIAKRFGHHRALFERLVADGDDFASAFAGVPLRLRLIHAYAWQSHLWNRAVAALVREATPARERIAVDGVEGPLLCYAGAPPPPLDAMASFRLPGEGLKDVKDPRQYELLQDALAEHRMVPGRMRSGGIAGFQLKGEDRMLILRPENLRARAPGDDRLNEGRAHVELSFELPRSSYATLVVRRLFGRAGARAPGVRLWGGKPRPMRYEQRAPPEPDPSFERPPRGRRGPPNFERRPPRRGPQD